MPLEDDIAEAVASSPRPLVVVGDGALAGRLRVALDAVTSDAPGTVVETTGSASGIREALSIVRDLGTVVLAGPAPAAPVELDLHDDLHVRGITVIGLAPSDG